MSQGEYIGEARGYLNVRPRKLGYLIQSNNYQQLEQAIVYATSEWGGFSQPIIPVHRRRQVRPRWWQFLQDLRPEFLIDYCGIDEGLKSRIEQELGSRVIGHPPLYDEPGVHATVAHSRGSLRGRTLFTAPDRASWGVKAALGLIPDEHRSPWEGLGAPLVPVEDPAEMLSAQTGQSPSPIELTRAGTSVFQTEGLMSSPVILFTGRQSFWLLVTFWNVRAGAVGSFSRSHVMFIPFATLRDPRLGDPLKEFCVQQRTRPDVVVVGTPAPEVSDALADLGFEPGTRRVTVPLVSNEPISRNLADEPLTYLLNIDAREFALGTRRDGIRRSVTVPLFRPATTITVETPTELVPIAGNVRYDLYGFDALTWPASASTAKLVHEAAEYTDYGLSFVGSPARVFERTLRIPDASDVATAFLADHGWRWGVSDKGRYVQAMLTDTPADLQGWALNGRLAIEIVQSMATMRRQRAEQLIAATGGDLGEDGLESLLRDLLPGIERQWKTASDIAGELSRPDRRVSRNQVEPVLTALVSDSLVQRGMRFRCPRCSLRQAVPLGRMDDVVACEGCRMRTPVSGSGGREPEIVYANNSLLDRVIEQDSLGDLLLLPLARKRHGAIWAMPGANLQSDAANREVDLLAVNRERLLMGETKARRSAFTEREVADVRALAEAIGARTVVLASMDEWPLAERGGATQSIGLAGIDAVIYDIVDLAPN